MNPILTLVLKKNKQKKTNPKLSIYYDKCGPPFERTRTLESENLFVAIINQPTRSGPSVTVVPN